MKRTLVIILSIATVIILSFHFRQVLKACAWEAGLGDYPVSFFNPNLQREQGNYPFYLSEKPLNYYYDYWWSNASMRGQHVLYPEDTNVSEWGAYFKNKASAKDIDTVVYSMNLARLTWIEQKNIVPDSMKYNKCLNLLVSTVYGDALKYLVFAKKCEDVYAVQQQGYWGPPVADHEKIKACIGEGLAMYKKVNDNAVKLRLAYQLVKLAGMMGDWQNCLSFCNQYVETSKVRSTIRNWAELWKATAIAKTGNKAAGCVLTSSVFESCKEKRPDAYMSLIYLNDGKQLNPADLGGIIAACKSDEDRANVMTMYALQQYYPDPQSLVEVYKYSPNIPMLENLIIREVNKVEDHALAKSLLSSYPKYSYLNTATEMGYYTDSLAGNTKENIQKLADVINGFITDGKIQNKALLYLVKGYLQLLQGDIKASLATLSDAKQYCVSNVKMEAQRHFLNLLCKVNECKKLDTKTENDIYPDLVWMEDTNNPIVTAQYKANIYRLLTQKYMTQDDFVKGLICLDKSIWEDKLSANDPYQQMNDGAIEFASQSYDVITTEGNHNNLDKLQKFLASDKRSDYDKLISSTFMFSMDRIFDFEGMLYLREYNYDKAVQCFSQIKPEYWKREKFMQYLEANPFYVGLGLPHSKTKADTVTYNKYTFCLKMQELERKADKNDPEALFEYANGLYNITHDGNSWLMVTDRWSQFDEFDSVSKTNKPGDESDFDYYGLQFPMIPFFYRDYGRGNKAKEYYYKAINASKDRELQARCWFLISRIDDPEGEYFSKDSIREDYTGFEALRTKYANTKFYDEIIHDCSYFNDYVAYKEK